ncbi:rCG20650 [Rattus norvegicus]|uniref:RCG20650 n=1 Tax=Rattus norvegicus TaxID=10116 RepID=A6JEH3_RAT|nr:rCG20650 [Rattus norvegicus]
MDMVPSRLSSSEDLMAMGETQMGRSLSGRGECWVRPNWGLL